MPVPVAHPHFAGRWARRGRVRRKGSEEEKAGATFILYALYFTVLRLRAATFKAGFVNFRALFTF